MRAVSARILLLLVVVCTAGAEGWVRQAIKGELFLILNVRVSGWSELVDRPWTS